MTIKPQNLYLALCVVGIVLPYSQFVPFLQEHGLDLGAFVGQMFANRISSFFALDVIVSSAVLVALVTIDGRRAGVQRLWLPIVANLTVGLSLGLPLFLYLRERRLASASPAGAGAVPGGTAR